MIFIVFFHTKPFFVFVQWLGDIDTLPWVIVTNKMLLTKSTNVVCFHPPPHHQLCWDPVMRHYFCDLNDEKVESDLMYSKTQRKTWVTHFWQI